MAIFLDKQDYAVFLSYLRAYLMPKDIQGLTRLWRSLDSTIWQKDEAFKQLKINNFHKRITLIAYCLMPNHFHLLIKQEGERDLELFMRSFMTRYTQYFNSRYKRVGPVYQGRYKAVLVSNEEQLFYLSRYIHRNPINLEDRDDKAFDQILLQPSSYLVYLGKVKQEWVKPEVILGVFSKTGFNSYQSFIEDREIEERTIITVGEVALDL